MPKISALPPATRAAQDDELPMHNVADGETQKATIGMIMPTGTILDYAGSAAPDGFLLCYGQALNAVTNPEYQDLYAVIGNTYGGSSNTDFVVPDLRGRVAAGQDDMGGSSANRLTNPASTTGGIDGDVLGGTGGAETHQLTVAQLAAHSHEPMSFSFTQNAGTSNTNPAAIHVGLNANRYSAEPQGSQNATNGSDDAHNNVQPTIILNKIIKY